MTSRSRTMKLIDGIEGLVPNLDQLAHDAERIVGARRIKLEDARHIASRLEDIRLLLHEAAGQTARLPSVAAHVLTIRRLAERYQALEGAVKEIRNDLQKECGMDSVRHGKIRRAQ